MGSESSVRRLTLGTAGHIDHGKTALVAALTGTGTDRLAEERRRGISIELGFAELELPDGTAVSVVDVPGHERLVRTMVAGAGGIDLFLLVVAADDGVMPQTREHVAVLRALGVGRGLIAITKCDLADGATRDQAAGEASELLPGAPVVRVSARSGEGLDELRRALGELAAGARSAPGAAAGPAVLHADRVFTLHGVGTVATGTLQGGAIERGQTVEVLPGGLSARVRSAEVHGRPVEVAAPGQRVALNLAGIDRAALARGDVIAKPGAGLGPSYRLDVELSLEPGAGELDGERLQVHHGTRDVAARLVALDVADGLAQLRLEAPLVARAGDRLVLRRIAPPDTLGGGTVLDPAPRRHGAGPPLARLRRIRDAGLAEVLAEEQTEAPPPVVEKAAPAPPLDQRALLVLALLRRDGATPRAPQALADAIRVPVAQVHAALSALTAAGHLARAGDVHFAAEALADLCEQAVELAGETGELTLPGVRDALGTSRKYAQALLEHLDSRGVTIRHGDRHVLRRPRANTLAAGRQGSGGPSGLQSQ